MHGFTPEEKKEIESISIGKWDIISEYHRLDWIKKGYGEEEAKIHGTVIAIVGYKARMGVSSQSLPLESKAGEQGVSVTHRKKEKWITSKEFDRIVEKIGDKYYRSVFSPAIEALYDRGCSYADVKKAVDIPPTIGAKVTLDRFLPFLRVHR